MARDQDARHGYRTGTLHRGVEIIGLAEGADRLIDLHDALRAVGVSSNRLARGMPS